jgi:uncharacterized membrane protein HdeD (DUF308 family)
MWATRQFALGFIFGFEVLKKSLVMLKTAYIFFLVMNIGDFMVGVSHWRFYGWRFPKRQFSHHWSNYYMLDFVNNTP